MIIQGGQSVSAAQLVKTPFLTVVILSSLWAETPFSLGSFFMLLNRSFFKFIWTSFATKLFFLKSKIPLLKKSLSFCGKLKFKFTKIFSPFNISSSIEKLNFFNLTWVCSSLSKIDVSLFELNIFLSLKKTTSVESKVNLEPISLFVSPLVYIFSLFFSYVM